MSFTIKNIQGIEGDDLLYHLSLLGYNINDIPNRYFFFPLNNHYNTHLDNWITEAKKKAEDAEVVVFYDLVNIDDMEHINFCKFITNFNHKCKVYLTVNQSLNLQLYDVKIIHWDFMWNRTKSYYTEIIPENLYLHHYAGPNAYRLPKLNFNNKSIKFLSLCGREFGYRTHLYNLVKEYQGYISNRSLNIYLESTEVTGVFHPIPNNFYLDSCLSVYVESNWLHSDLIHITEKTFEPLIKGHFILPFSNPGIINRILKLGFKLPNFINYDYDNIINTEVRFEMYRKEFLRLMDMDLNKFYIQHKDMLLHNQRCINTIPYDTNILEIFDV